MPKVTSYLQALWSAEQFVVVTALVTVVATVGEGCAFSDATREPEAFLQNAETLADSVTCHGVAGQPVLVLRHAVGLLGFLLRRPAVLFASFLGMIGGPVRRKHRTFDIR